MADFAGLMLVLATVCDSSAQTASSQLTFTSNRGGDFDIYVMNDDGSTVVQLTNDPGMDVDPAWSPDGQWIAFSSNRDGDFEIFVMNADGTDVVQMTHTDASAQDRAPKWSPDGRFLVFHRPFEPQTGRHIDLYQVELATGTITRLTFGGGSRSSGGLPDWSPEARIIIQRHTDASDWELAVRDPDGTVTQLTNNSRHDQDPDWFPGGVRAAFVVSTISNPGDGDIWAIELATGTQTPLTSGPARDRGPSVSCDGSRIAFHRVAPGEFTLQIWVMAADGTGPVNISNDPDSDNHSPDWRCTPPDVTPPVLTLPGTMMVEATSASGAVVSFTTSASDTVDGPRPVTCSLASGSTFPLGATSVNCSASDTQGNTAADSFTVIVGDSTPPALTLPSNIVAGATSGAGGPVSYGATATDLVDGNVGVACSPVSGSMFPIGSTTVSCTATDSRGNEATGVFTVTIDCCRIALTVNPSSAQRREPVLITGTVQNFSSTTKNVTLQFEFTSPITAKMGSFSLTLAANTNKSRTVPFKIPANARSGTYTLKLTTVTSVSKIETLTTFQVLP